MHNYCSTCAFMHNFTPIDMGVFFLSKCVKWHTFSILQDYATTDVVALKGCKCVKFVIFLFCID